VVSSFIMDGNKREEHRQYAIDKMNKLIKQIEHIRDNLIEEELRSKFFNLCCLMSDWEMKTIIMGIHIETAEERKTRLEYERQRERKMGLSDEEQLS